MTGIQLLRTNRLFKVAFSAGAKRTSTSWAIYEIRFSRFMKETPKVPDPFAGGGAIPFEAMRIGCEVSARNLNPVAWLILKCTLEYPQRFAGKTWPLPDFVNEWPDFIDDFRKGKVKKRKSDRRTHFADSKQLTMANCPKPILHVSSGHGDVGYWSVP